MKKFIFIKDGKEIKIGDKLACGIDSLHGYIPLNTIIINEKSIPFLIREGIIKEVEVEGTHVDPNFYLEHLAERIHWNIDNLKKYIDNLYIIYPAAVISIILREIAIVFDEKYSNHIENSKEIYSISLLNGEVYKVKDLNKIKNFKNFAAFRTLLEAVAAKHILKDYIKYLFEKSGESKD